MTAANDVSKAKALHAKIVQMKPADSVRAELEAMQVELGALLALDRRPAPEEVASLKRHLRDAEHAAAPAVDPAEQPTSVEPLRGLSRLGPIALVGRATIAARAFEPVPYVWQDIAVRATIVLLAGGPGEGKTTLLFLLAAARINIEAPVKVLLREVKPAPPGQFFVLIEGEHGESSASRKLVKSCTMLGIHDDSLNRIIILARRSVRVGSPEWDDIVRMVKAGIVSDIALDTVARVAPADANDEREQVAIFDLITQAIDQAPSEETKPVVWGVAHTKKGGTGSLEDVSGSTQRTGQADSVLLVKGEKQGGRTFHSTVTFAKLREDPDDYPMPVTFSIKRDPREPYGVPQLVTLSDQDLKSDADDDSPLETRILKAIALRPKTKTALATELGRSKNDLEAAITNLFDTRRIVTSSILVKGVSRKAFACAPATRDEHGTPPPSSGTRDEHGTKVRCSS